MNNDQPQPARTSATSEEKIVSEWQPIETAPKDGTYVDLWSKYDDRRVTDCRWNSMKKLWEHWWLGDFDNMEMVRVDSEVTHWMTAPSPPVQP